MGTEDLAPGAAWVDSISRAELQAEFAEWGPDVRCLVGCMPEQTLRWSVHVVYPPLESYSRGRVALLGDAVCASFPSCSLSQGVLGFNVG